jgi:hypothetical protein
MGRGARPFRVAVRRALFRSPLVGLAVQKACRGARAVSLAPLLVLARSPRTHLVHKSEHAVDMEARAVVAVTLQESHLSDG